MELIETIQPGYLFYRGLMFAFLIEGAAALFGYGMYLAVTSI